MISFILSEKSNTTVTRMDNGDWFNSTTELLYPKDCYTAMFYERLLQEKLAQLSSYWLAETDVTIDDIPY